MSFILYSLATGKMVPLPDYDLMVMLLLVAITVIMKKSREDRGCKPGMVY